MLVFVILSLLIIQNKPQQIKTTTVLIILFWLVHITWGGRPTIQLSLEVKVATVQNLWQETEVPSPNYSPNLEESFCCLGLLSKKLNPVPAKIVTKKVTHVHVKY